MRPRFRRRPAVDSLDLLINNAGVALYDDLGDRGALEQHLAVNLFGTYGVTRAFLPLLTDSRGAIVNNLSLNALAPLPLIPAYSVSKAAAFSLTQSLRALLAGQGVSVHAVLTGPTDTEMNRGPRHTEGLCGVSGASHLRRSGDGGGRHLPRSPVPVPGAGLACWPGQGVRARACGVRRHPSRHEREEGHSVRRRRELPGQLRADGMRQGSRSAALAGAGPAAGPGHPGPAPGRPRRRPRWR